MASGAALACVPSRRRLHEKAIASGVKSIRLFPNPKKLGNRNVEIIFG
jgi:hypothetical protein